MLLEFADAVFFNIAFCKDLDRIPTRSIKHSIDANTLILALKLSLESKWEQSFATIRRCRPANEEQ